jgi:hypothetical protein
LESSGGVGFPPTTICVFFQPQKVSTGDRRCLGRTAWGKSLSTKEVDRGVLVARERGSQPLSCESPAGCAPSGTRLPPRGGSPPYAAEGLERLRLCLWIRSIAEVDERHVAREPRLIAGK